MLWQSRVVRPIALNKCPVPGCPYEPRPFFCGVHWPFVSQESRARIVRFAKMLRGGRDAMVPTMRKLLRGAVRDVRNAPAVQWNWADRLVVLVHRLVCGRRA